MSSAFYVGISELFTKDLVVGYEKFTRTFAPLEVGEGMQLVQHVQGITLKDLGYLACDCSSDEEFPNIEITTRGIQTETLEAYLVKHDIWFAKV